jgi:catechol 2,3-dioxygenase-like lactoylglutathione lyase family enzyme
MDIKELFKGIDQVGLVVHNIEKSLEHYTTMFGIGPWQIYTFQPPLVTDMTFRGKPAIYRMKIALTMLGSVMLELIEPLEGENIYKEFLDARGEGVHHIGCYIDNLDQGVQAMEQVGIKVLQSGRFVDGGYAYLDTEKSLGIIFELIQMPSQMPPAEAIRS